MWGVSGTATVTVLFTDLVDSTKIMSLIGDVAFDELRQSHLSLLGQIIIAHGGVEVKTLGDGVMAVFRAASNAVAAAAAMQQAVQRRSRRARHRLSMRVGAALGDATEHDGDWFGTPVVAQGRSRSHFTQVGTVTLRGLPAETAIWRLEWAQMASPAAVALPGPLRVTEMTGFVGRLGERTTLRAAFERAAAGSRQVLLVGGEPGVGKSRLVAEFAREVHARGTNVLFGRCDEGLSVPYQPFVEMLSHYIQHCSPAGLVPGLGHLAGELTRLVPELTTLVAGLPSPVRSSPEVEQYRLFEAMASWLATASAEEPLLVVLDDLHWATQPTLSLLRHVARASSSVQLLIVGIYRQTEIDPARSVANLLADLRRDPGMERLLLSGLDEAEVMELLANTGHSLGQDVRRLARSILTHTAGNPFFVGELVRHAIESGTLDQRLITLEHLGIPEGVHDVVLRRLGQLSEAANHVLMTAAVVGAEFDLAVVTAVTGLGEEAVTDALEQAMTAGLVKEVAGVELRFRFRHALVRASLYDCLSATRRHRLHRRVGEAIEVLHQPRLEEHLPALAHHFTQAATSEDAATAVDYTWRAGDRALAQLAYDQAVELYTRALELFDHSERSVDPLRRCDLLIALGDAQRRAAHPAHRQTLLAAAAVARQAEDGDRLAAAALANTRMIGPATQVDPDRVAVLSEALEVISDQDSPVRAKLLANLAGELFSGEWDRRVELSAQAVAMARRLACPATLAQVLVPVLRTLRHPSTLTRRLGLIAELAELAQRLESADAAFSAAWYGFSAALEAGEIALVRRHLADATRLADELAQPALRWVMAVPNITLTVLAGRLAEGERLAHLALEAGIRADHPDARVFFACQLLMIGLAQDRLSHLETLFTRSAAQYPDEWVWQAILARVFCRLGRVDDARVVLGKLAANDFANLPRNVGWLTGMTLCAEVCAELGNVTDGAALTCLLAPYADQFVTAGPVIFLGSVAHYLGQLALTGDDLDDADAHFAAAAAAHTRIGASVWLVRTHLDWSAMLLTRRHYGDVRQAADLLSQAQVTARELGLNTLEQRARTLLQQV
jgi:AAA ATPase domain/Adenylate and Guanylate cyclase catalytic domain